MKRGTGKKKWREIQDEISKKIIPEELFEMVKGKGNEKEIEKIVKRAYKDGDFESIAMVELKNLFCSSKTTPFTAEEIESIKEKWERAGWTELSKFLTAKPKNPIKDLRGDAGNLVISKRISIPYNNRNQITYAVKLLKNARAFLFSNSDLVLFDLRNEKTLWTTKIKKNVMLANNDEFLLEAEYNESKSGKMSMSKLDTHKNVWTQSTPRGVFCYGWTLSNKRLAYYEMRKKTPNDIDVKLIVRKIKNGEVVFSRPVSNVLLNPPKIEGRTIVCENNDRTVSCMFDLNNGNFIGEKSIGPRVQSKKYANETAFAQRMNVIQATAQFQNTIFSSTVSQVLLRSRSNSRYRSTTDTSFIETSSRVPGYSFETKKETDGITLTFKKDITGQVVWQRKGLGKDPRFRGDVVVLSGVGDNGSKCEFIDIFTGKSLGMIPEHTFNNISSLASNIKYSKENESLSFVYNNRRQATVYYLKKGEGLKTRSINGRNYNMHVMVAGSKAIYIDTSGRNKYYMITYDLQSGKEAKRVLLKGNMRSTIIVPWENGVTVFGYGTGISFKLVDRGISLKKAKTFFKKGNAVLTPEILEDFKFSNNHEIQLKLVEEILFKNPTRVSNVDVYNNLRELFRKMQEKKLPSKFELAFKELPANVKCDGKLAKYGKPVYKVDKILNCTLMPSVNVVRGRAKPRTLYTGKEDCSLKIYGGWNKKKLMMAIEVKDDIHVPKNIEYVSDSKFDSLRLFFYIASKSRNHELEAFLDNKGKVHRTHEAFRIKEKAVVKIVRDEKKKTTIYEFEISPGSFFRNEKNPVFKKNSVYSTGISVYDDDGKGVESILSPQKLLQNFNRDKLWQIKLKGK